MRTRVGRGQKIFISTLKFLGNISTASVSDFSEAASRAASSVKRFEIRVEQTGVFPPRGLPRVLWLGVNDGDGKLAQLHKRLEAESGKAGFLPEHRPFRPHLTIARVRQAAHASALAAAHVQMEFDPLELVVSELLVIRSELGSAGSKYTVISSHPLQ